MIRRVRNGAGFVGARSSVEAEPRRPGDLYPTRDRDVTGALIVAERARILRHLAGEPVLEPACGHGDMVSVLQAFGFTVDARDIEPRGCGRRQDFLAARGARPVMITNPPFSLAIEFIEHALRLGVRYLALLLKADFWQVGARQDARRDALWRAWPPSIVYALTWRPDFTRGGAGRPFLNLAWNVWAGRPGERRSPTSYALLSRKGVVGIHA